jgi:hypothetical protein
MTDTMGNEYIKRPIYSNMLRNLPSTDSYLFSDKDINLQLRSTAGVTKVSILNASTVEVASINSLGVASFTGLAATSDFDVTGSFAVNTDDFVVSATSDISMKPTGGDVRITLGDAAGARKLFIKDSANSTVATIDSDGTATVVKLTASSDISGQTVAASSNLTGLNLAINTNDFVVSGTSDITMIPTGGNVKITLGDAAGANKFYIRDSASSTMATIDSDGTATVVKLTASSDISGQSIAASSNLSGAHVTASSNFVGSGSVQGVGFIDSYLAKTTGTVLTAIPNKGFTSLAQTNTTQVTWTLADPTAVGFTKTIFVLSQTGTTARTFILPASTQTFFASSQSSTDRKITFDDAREAVSLVSASTRLWLVYNNQFGAFGAS